MGFVQLAKGTTLNRRSFSQNLLSALGLGLISASKNVAFTVPRENQHVGLFADERWPTGCTIVLCEGGAVCGVEVAGGWPGTRLTDVLDPTKRADNLIRVQGIVLSGGSNYGLDTANGVERYFRERLLGYAEVQSESAGPRNLRFRPTIIYDLDISGPGGDWRFLCRGQYAAD